MEGKDGKTERATAKKRSKERKDGNVCISQEINSMIVLLLGLLALRIAVPAGYAKLQALLIHITAFDSLGGWDSASVGEQFRGGCVYVAGIVGPLFALAMVGAVVANMSQTGPFFSMKTLRVKFSSLNPIKGIKNIFSAQSIVKLVTAILKIALIVTVSWFLLRKKIGIVVGLSSLSSESAILWTFELIFRIAITVVIIFVCVAALDWCYRKYKHEQKMMMTKQEVKDERKQEQINPQVKRAQAKKMREFSLMRMMSAVPNANVIITNPTRVAIALEYDPQKMDAPKVTAKGLRLVAKRIKKIARENNIPIIEKPETARSLYKHAPLGKPIPARFYESVAEVLAYLHRIGRGITSIG